MGAAAPAKRPKASSTKHSYASKDPDYDWRNQVIWVCSPVLKDLVVQWMADSRRKWADVWWEHEQFLRLGEEYRGLVPPKCVGSAVFEAIKHSRGVRLMGWLNVADVIRDVAKAKHKGMVAFDVFAAGVGTLGCRLLMRRSAEARPEIPELQKIARQRCQRYKKRCPGN